MARDLSTALWLSRASAVRFDDVACVCFFIGYPRSGHSLVGALLDAHPNVIVAHELDLLKYLRYPPFRHWYGREALFHLLLRNSRNYASHGRKWGTFCYEVPGQYQGRFTELVVIGDKKGGATTVRLMENPWLLEVLRKKFGPGIRTIHVTRNPYDNIATMARRGRTSLEEAIRFYFALCETNARLIGEIPGHALLQFKHESLLADCAGVLERACEFLGVTAEPGYLEACRTLVHAKPHKSREETDWSDVQRREVEAGIGQYPFLEGYSFDD